MHLVCCGFLSHHPLVCTNPARDIFICMCLSVYIIPLGCYLSDYELWECVIVFVCVFRGIKKNPCISAYLFRLAIIYRMFSYQIYVYIAYVYLQIYCLLYIYVYVCMLWLLVRFLRYQIFIFPFVVYDYLTKLVLLHNIVSSSPPPPPARLLLRFFVLLLLLLL